MAKGKGIAILALAAAALFALGKRRTTTDDDGGVDDGDDASPFSATRATPKAGGAMPAYKPPPTPDDMWERFTTGAPPAVDQCFTGPDMEVDELKACALAEVFPEASWPPPSSAHQWQRNLWANPEFNEHVQGKYPPIA